VFAEKRLSKLIHPSLHGEASSRLGGQIWRSVHVAPLCVQEDPANRPSMWDVLLMANGSAGAELPIPKRPARQYGNTQRFLDSVRGYKETITVVMRQE
jgi:hypothetical protein